MIRRPLRAGLKSVIDASALTALASGIAKGISILTGLITIPLTLGYLGVERYGVWMTISSVVLMMGFADLGMGNGLLNAISEAHGNDDRQAALNYVSSGFFMLLGVALLIVLVFILAYPFVPWPTVFNIKSKLAAQEAGPAMAAFVVIFALNLPLGVVQRVQMGYQEGYQTSLYQCLGSIFGLIAVLLVIYVEGGLAWLVLAMAGGPVLGLTHKLGDIVQIPTSLVTAAVAQCHLGICQKNIPYRHPVLRTAACGGFCLRFR